MPFTTYRTRRHAPVMAALALLLAVCPYALTAEPPAAPSQPAPAPAVTTAPKTLADLQAVEARVKEVTAKVMGAVVGVRMSNSQGSGVIVSEDGYVLTAAHVSGQPNQQVTFLFADGKTAKGVSLGVSRTADAGLMKITDPGKWPFLEKGRSKAFVVGDWCIAMGHPLGYQEGRPPVIRVGRLLRDQGPMLQTDCTLVAGDSGGPLLDLEGRVVGIHSRIAGSVSMNFHVPIDVFHQSWDRLMKGDAWDDNLPGKDSAEVKAIVQPTLTPAAACVVRVLSDSEEIALGTIIGPDGWIVTKASQLGTRTICRLRDGRLLEARVVGVQPQFDLAMLKVEARGLPAIQWHAGQVPVGQWVAAPGFQDDAPLALGVVSVPPRKILPAAGILGVMLADGDQGARVLQVAPGGPAEKAGLKADDHILELDGKAVQNQSEVVAAVKHHRLGDTVKLKVKRGTETLDLSATLGKLDSPGMRKRDMQNKSDIGISERSDDFPLVLQHDTVLRPSDCGGPLVDLSGGVVGVNIARAGRTETYSVPAPVLMGLMYDLMSGKLSPTPASAAPAPTTPPKYYEDRREGEPGEPVPGGA